MFGLGTDDLLGGDVIEFHQGIGQFRARGLLEGAGFFDLVGPDQPLGYKDVGEVAATLRHLNGLRSGDRRGRGGAIENPCAPCNRHARGTRVPVLTGNFPSSYGTRENDASEKTREVDYSSWFAPS